MATTSITIKELEVILDCMPEKQNIMLTGKHGIGKSQIIAEYFKKKGIRVQNLFLGQMSDPGDIIGLPKQIEQVVEKLDANGNKVTTVAFQTIYALPFWFPVDDQPIVLFLDELNRARPEVLQAIMDLALNRTIAGQSLPKGSRIVSAVNEGDEYQLTELDPALVDRFNVYNLCPTAAEWLLYAEEKGLDKRVRDFIEHNTELLDSNVQKRDSDLDKTPSRRSWEKVSDAIKGLSGFTNPHKKMIAGIIGSQAALAFFNYLVQTESVTGEDVILKYDEDLKNKIFQLSTHDWSLLNESIFRFLSVGKYDKLVAVPNLDAYLHDLFDSNKKEIQANFASNFENMTMYKKAIGFIISNLPQALDMIKNFIKNM